MKQESPFIKIAVLEKAIEAQLLSSVLTQYEILYRTANWRDQTNEELEQKDTGILIEP
jgi:hypothetical protein